jgi:hypothetical protein
MMVVTALSARLGATVFTMSSVAHLCAAEQCHWQSIMSLNVCHPFKLEQTPNSKWNFEEEKITFVLYTYIMYLHLKNYYWNDYNSLHENRQWKIMNNNLHHRETIEKLTGKIKISKNGGVIKNYLGKNK